MCTRKIGMFSYSKKLQDHHFCVLAENDLRCGGCSHSILSQGFGKLWYVKYFLFFGLGMLHSFTHRSFTVLGYILLGIWTDTGVSAGTSGMVFPSHIMLSCFRRYCKTVSPTSSQNINTTFHFALPKTFCFLVLLSLPSMLASTSPECLPCYGTLYPNLSSYILLCPHLGDP